jgi:hypothetical protein
MLTSGDGAKGANFLLPEIFEYALKRQEANPAGIERHRLLCNMLSSQPMCFNLFGPSALDLDLGRGLVEAMLDGRLLAKISTPVFEHAPQPKKLYLNDSTSFDVFFEVVDVDGALGFVAVETKLTEPFSKKRYRIDERSAYREWVNHPRAPWIRGPAADLDAIEHNQLFRNHALAFARLHTGTPKYEFGYSVVVHHALDEKCNRSLTGYRHQLASEHDVPLLARSLQDLTVAFRPVVEGTRFERWLTDFRERYVVLDGSAEIGQ